MDFYLLNPLNDLVLCAFACQPLVEVGDHVDADVTEQVLRLRTLVPQQVPRQGLHQGQAGGDEEGRQEEAQHLAAVESICSQYTDRIDQAAVYIDISYLEPRQSVTFKIPELR